MRKFNDFEKEILTKIANNETFVANFIDRHLSGVRITVNKTSKKVSYLFDVEDKNNIQGKETENIHYKLNEINGIIITLVNLLGYLEKKEWISVVKTVTIEENIMTFGQGISYKDGGINKDFINYDMSDANIIEKFIKYCYNSILPSTELTYFVTSGFLTEEQINYQKEEEKQSKNNEISLKNIEATKENIRIAKSNNKATLIIAIAAGLTLLVTIYFNIYGKVSINEKQLDNLIETFDNISFSIDSINSKNDTINAHIFSLKDSVNVRILNKKKEAKPKNEKEKKKKKKKEKIKTEEVK